MHDLGGKQGFGPVVPFARKPKSSTPNGRRRANALLASQSSTASSTWTSTTRIERMEPRHYLSAATTNALHRPPHPAVEKGVVTREELERLAGGAIPLSRPSAPGRPNAPAASASSPATACA